MSERLPPVLEIADDNERELELAVFKALKATQAAANITAFTKAYASGDVAGAMKALNLDTLADKLTNG